MPIDSEHFSVAEAVTADPEALPGAVVDSVAEPPALLVAECFESERVELQLLSTRRRPATIAAAPANLEVTKHPV